jgi:ABC-2 type transporter
LVGKCLTADRFASVTLKYFLSNLFIFCKTQYVLARSIAAIPIGMIDALYFGSYIYFLVGLALNQGSASVANYFLFMLILFISAWTSGLFFSIYSSCIQTVTSAQALLAVTLILMLLFCGFTVQPNVIPAYYIWIYWINYFSWLFRAVVVNEFDSGRYNQLVNSPTGEVITEGEAILIRFGFVDGNDIPYTFEWVYWAILFSFGAAVVACCVAIFCLSNIRFATGQTLVTDTGTAEPETIEETKDDVQIPFKKVDLTFKDIHYTVKASTSDEKLELLKGIDGVVQAGKMTALMG